ncbi:LamG-like jellyroll fold domain-containing protein [Cereibacter sphaeroides f. sp. denitrificans]
MAGIGIGIGLTAQRRRRHFSFADLFTSGDGFIYPIAPGTRWQDAAGTLPVDAAEQQIAFAQDGSEGLARGLELVTNGGFDTDAGWTKDPLSSGVPWVISGGKASISGAQASATDLYQMLAVVAGRFYELAFDYVSGAGSLALQARALNLVSGINTGVSPAPGTRVRMIFSTSGASAIVTVRAGSGVSATIDNISVREILGFHAIQSGAASTRPTYREGPVRLSLDGIDDKLLTPWKPTASGTIGCMFRTDSAASRILIGSAGATDGRCYLGIGSDGRLGGGIGTQAMAVIAGGSDLRGTGWHSGIMSWDGATAHLYLDGVEVYSAAQAGAVNTTIPMMVGALNANGVPGSFFLGDILPNPVALDYAATAAQIASLHRAWSMQQ